MKKKLKKRVALFSLVTVITVQFVAFSDNKASNRSSPKTFSSIEIGKGLKPIKEAVKPDQFEKSFNSNKTSKINRSMNDADKNTIEELLVQTIRSNLQNKKIDFQSDRTYIDNKENRHYIFKQYIDGLYVEGGQVTFHFNKDWQLLEITGAINDANSISNTSPEISRSDAERRGINYFNGKVKISKDANLSIVDRRVVWQFAVKDIDPSNPESWKVYVDANSGELLSVQSELQYLDPPGFPSSGSITAQSGNLINRETGKLVNFNAWLDNSTIPGNYYLYNNSEHWQATNWLSSPQSIFWNPTANWGTSNQAAVSVAYNISQVQSFVKRILNRNSIDDQGMMAICWYGDNYAGAANAFYSPSTDDFHFGTGDGTAANEYCALDVVSHEIGHGITAHTSNLDYGSVEPAALNESYSDILAASVEFDLQPDGRSFFPNNPRFAAGHSDWLRAEDVKIQGGVPSYHRNMRNPALSLPFACPSLYKGSNYADYYGNQHYNSLVSSFCYYLISEGVGVESVNDTSFDHIYGPFRGLGVSAALQIAWQSQFNGQITSSTGFREARNAWIFTAKQLSYDAGIVAQAWAAVGVIDRTVGRPSTTTLPGTIPDYPSIQAAIDASVAGDMIYIYPGTYSGNITITTNNITIVGRNKDNTFIDGTVLVNGSADGFTLAGVTIDASSTTDAVTMNGIPSNTVNSCCISGCAILNSRTGIQGINTIASQLVNCSFTTCGQNSIALNNCTTIWCAENNINGTGILIGSSSANNVISENLLNTTSDGLRLSAGANGTRITNNTFNTIGGYEIIADAAVSNVQVISNAFWSPTTCDFSIPSGSTGEISGNTFASTAYSFVTPGTISWNDSNNQGNFWNSNPGIDTHPLSLPVVSPLRISNGTQVQAWTSSDGLSLKLNGTIVNGTLSGLKFGNAASISNNGDLISAQHLHNSERWLTDNESNLAGGLVIKNSQNKSAFYIGADGIVRVRGLSSPNL